MSVHDLPDPPPPPHASRHVKLYPFQWVGLFVLALLPMLAALGVFGVSRQVEHARAGTLDVTVRYPSRFRYEQFEHIEVHVRNASAAPLDSVRVLVDSALLSRFFSVVSTPPLVAAWELVIPLIPAGGTRLAVIEIRAKRHGRHSGTLTVAARDTVRVPLSILAFP